MVFQSLPNLVIINICFRFVDRGKIVSTKNEHCQIVVWALDNCLLSSGQLYPGTYRVQKSRKLDMIWKAVPIGGLRPTFSPLKGKSWLLNHVIYFRNWDKLSVYLSRLEGKIYSYTKKSHLALNNLAKLVFWLILSFKIEK